MTTVRCDSCGAPVAGAECAYCGSTVRAPAHSAVTQSGLCEIEDSAIRLCGVPAVGLCNKCHRRFCPTHQARDTDASGGVFPYTARCVECRHGEVRESRLRSIEQEAAIRARREAQLEADLASYEEGRARWQGEVASIVATARQVGDPVERLLLAVSQWTRQMNGPDRNGDMLLYWVELLPGTADTFCEVFPHFWAKPESVNFRHLPPPWDSDAVAHWTARRARTEGWEARAREWDIRSGGKRKGRRVPGGPGYTIFEQGTHRKIRISVQGKLILEPHVCYITALGLRTLAERFRLVSPNIRIPLPPQAQKHSSSDCQSC